MLEGQDIRWMMLAVEWIQKAAPLILKFHLSMGRRSLQSDKNGQDNYARQEFYLFHLIQSLRSIALFCERLTPHPLVQFVEPHAAGPAQSLHVRSWRSLGIHHRHQVI